MKVRTIASVANKQRVRTPHLKNDLFQVHTTRKYLTTGKSHQIVKQFSNLNGNTKEKEKGLINLAVAGLQDNSKQHLIKNEEQPSFSKQLCTFLHELFNPTDPSSPALTLGVL